ncbi:septal ring lytic transglycosylase RlpA family protein [Novosphingobium sp. PC22D]|uniref:septal ring lytic transglycosylase RlpA family protein n=1 Tax=Novosphingobium sp. PC22D TaxID=1962403 RepID=UPI000BEF5AEE|nr:septal ring lytic transglycosylase RlpA family protein [Novosphingobium sp. PC22D]
MGQRLGQRAGIFGPAITFAAAIALPVSGLALLGAAESPAIAGETLTTRATNPAFAGVADAVRAAPASTDLLGQAEAEAARQDETATDTAEPIGSGVASYYGRKFAGRRTASGDVFDPTQLTAAHRTLPFGSRVRVTNRRNGKTVIVKINDRGPFHADRVIDLSRAAAGEIGLVGPGSGKVELALLSD